jgi:Zn-dependent peptidase ImmA (M78 family)
VVQPEHKARVRALAAEFERNTQGRDPLTLAAAIGADLQYGDLGDKDGAFDPSRNVILLNKASGPERQRFTLAHELTHALILGDGDLLSDLHDAYEGDELEEAIEVLCNVGASAILVPEGELAELLSRCGRGARVIPKLASTFGVSRAAACIALAQHLDAKAIVAILRPRGRGRGKHLEVEFATKSDGMKYSLSPGVVIPEDHAAEVAFETGLPIEGQDVIPFRSGRRMPAHVDAHPEGGLVYAVFTTSL